MKTPARRYLVTAALPYANGKIHLGHLAGAYLPADIYVRFLRSLKRDVLFVCGSDEHGVAIIIAADQEGTTPQALVDRIHELNKATFAKFGMSFDIYSRTSMPLHHEFSQKFFLAVHKAGILKEKREQQLYDPAAGMFLPDRYVEGTCPVCANPDARGDQCEKCGTFLSPLELINPRSKISGGTPTVKESTHWYFPLADFQQRLQRYIREADARDGWKENVKQYCEGWFKDGLKDRAVTRDLSWGVRVPLAGFEDKVIYVWFDAVLGYISATQQWAREAGHPRRWETYWLDPETKYVAFIGKDNVVFHCIVFPAMLMAWNDHAPRHFVLPENVPANEFLNFQGQKFSKSRGWGTDVDEFLSRFPADTLRYTLAMNLPETRDADFTWNDFQARTNNELADILGNLVNRTLTFVQRNFGGKVPAPAAMGPADRALVEEISATARRAAAAYEQYKIRDGTLEVMNLARAANKYFNDAEPWKTQKSDPARCATSLYVCLTAIRALAILMEPVIPAAAARMWTMLNLAGTPGAAGWDHAHELALEAGHALGAPEILFTKIEDEVIQQQLDQLPKADPPAPVVAGQKPLVSIDDFRKIDLRTATILAAERVPKSKKLLKLRVSLGTEERQIIAGIGQHYQPEELVGKSVVVVANLAPARLMGEESQGMLLAASDDGGALSILTTAVTLPAGSGIK